MRKLIAEEWLSVDGFAADERGSTDFFAASEFSAGSDEDLRRSINQIDTILLGATTYREFLSYWPTAASAQEIIADRLNATLKVVFSNSLQTVAWGQWEPPTLLHGAAEDHVRGLKQQPGKDIVLWGSLTLFQSLLRAGLVDELRIRTVPVVLGKGRRLFADGDTARLQSTRVKRYDSGLTLTEFVVQP